MTSSRLEVGVIHVDRGLLHYAISPLSVFGVHGLKGIENSVRLMTDSSVWVLEFCEVIGSLTATVY